MSSFRKLKAIVVGQDGDAASATATLEAASVPVSTADCRGCADPCDEGHPEYPKKFDVDRETQLLGQVKSLCRQVVISTGKFDWAKEVTDVQGTLAAYAQEVQEGAKSRGNRPKSKESSLVPGVYNSSQGTKIGILNGSHKTVADDPAHETVLVFPDFKIVTGVPRSLEGAHELWDHAIDPALGRAGAPASEESSLKSWVLPYNCVILLCSHKRRDNRCAIAAPILESAFTASFERAGWAVHTQLEDPSLSGSAIDEIQGTPEERDAEVLKRLRALDDEDLKKALVLMNSHIGGHKFAGNAIIYTPRGAGVWYGRVTPHEVDAIVKHTIIEGKILPALLRGGFNLARPGCKSINDW